MSREYWRKRQAESERASKLGGRTDLASLCYGATLIIQMTDLFRARETHHCTQRPEHIAARTTTLLNIISDVDAKGWFLFILF